VTNEELERRVAALEHDHSLTRWYTGRVDRDLAEIAATQTEHTVRLDRIEATQAAHTATLVEHTGRFDSLDSQMQSLTQLVGQVLKRLPEPDEADD
jgi:hypothetical protein